MMIQESIFHIKIVDKIHAIKCIQTGDTLLESNFNFWLLTEDNEIELKTKADKELIQDLYAVVALDPVKELANIMREEIKKELEANYD